MKLKFKTIPGLNLIEIPIIINNQDENHIVLDIGARMTIIQEEFCSKFDIEKLDEFMEGRTAHGPLKHRKGLIKTLRVGEFQFNDVKVGLGLTKFTKMLHQDKKYIGVLGHNILKSFNAFIDYKNEELTLVKNSDSIFEDSKEISFEYIGPHLVNIPCKVNSSNEYPFILDTGAGGSLINSTVVEQLNLSSIESDIYVASPSGKTKANYTVVEELKTPFNTIKEKNLIIMPLDHLFEGSEKTMGGILGVDFLKEFILNINYPEQTVNLIKT